MTDKTLGFVLLYRETSRSQAPDGTVLYGNLTGSGLLQEWTGAIWQGEVAQPPVPIVATVLAVLDTVGCWQRHGHPPTRISQTLSTHVTAQVEVGYLAADPDWRVTLTWGDAPSGLPPESLVLTLTQFWHDLRACGGAAPLPPPATTAPGDTPPHEPFSLLFRCSCGKEMTLLYLPVRAGVSTPVPLDPTWVRGPTGWTCGAPDHAATVGS